MKGQIEFGETIMVVIVIVFLLVIGLVFYYNVSASQIRQEISHREDIDGIVLGKRVLALPEIECSVTEGGSCIDYYKTSALSGLIQSDDAIESYYGSLFGYSTIKIAPLDEDELGEELEEITLYDDPLMGEVSISQQFLFTTIYDAKQKLTRIAYMNITRYTVARE